MPDPQNSAPADDIQLFAKPFSAQAALDAVTHPDAGGIDLFLGITRAENHPQHGPLVALEYHAYPEMALRQLQAIAQESRRKWPVVRLVLWHRIGTVKVGEPSVVIAVSCPHRAEAFDSCRFLIEELKKNVPIWKQEIYANDSRWQLPDPAP